MDLVRDRTSIIEEEGEKEDENKDRISNLPDELIHHIVSFLDMKYAVQTSALSHQWEHIWTSSHHLNFNSRTFRTPSLFARFVKHVLSHRNNDVEVSKVQLTITGAASPFVVKSIVNNVYLNNVRELNMTWLTRKFHQFPECLFSSHTLKHLSLATSDQSFYVHKTSCIPKVDWNFPALETVCLSSMHLGDKGDESLDLFSKCVNLRDLSLHKCCMYGLKIFKICAPELSNLTITDATSYPDVVNIVAPKLENLTASVKGTINRFPFKYESLQLSTEGFNSLEKVNLSLSMPHYEQKRFFPLLLSLFHKLRHTKYLVINLDIIETLSLCLEQLSHEPCPFDNLKGLKINMESQMQKDHIATIPTQVRNYLLKNSPSATFIMDLPQVPQKRSRQQVHDETRANKVAKLKTENKQPETVAQEMRMLEANISHPSTNVRIQSNVHTAELPPSARLSSSVHQKPTSSGVDGSGSNMDVQPSN